MIKRVYLAGGISDTARKEYHKKIANKLREFGYVVYSASENDSINDKSNNPTPEDIYNADIDRIMECDIFLVCLTGGNEDGTISEIGMVAGWNECILEYNKMVSSFSHKKSIELMAYTTNERLLDPDISQGIPSASLNHLVLGMIQKWGRLIGNENDMLKVMKDISKY